MLRSSVIGCAVLVAWYWLMLLLPPSPQAVRRAQAALGGAVGRPGASASLLEAPVSGKRAKKRRPGRKPTILQIERFRRFKV